MFSLFIAAAGVSLLVYFIYAPQIPYTLQYSTASAFINSLASTKMSQLTIPYVQAITQQGLASNQTWLTVYQDPANNGGNPAGPQYPTVAYALNTGGFPQPGTLVAGYGNVYFGNSGSTIIAMNATTGNIIWQITPPTNTVCPLCGTSNYSLLYNRMLIFESVSNITALNALNGSVIWSRGMLYRSGRAEPNAGVLLAPLSIMNGLLIVGTNDPVSNTGVGLYAVYPNNGAIASISSYGGLAQFDAAAGSQIAVGSYSVSTLSLLTALQNASNSGALVWNAIGPADTDISASGGTIAFASTTRGYLYSMSGNTIASTALSQPTGVSSYRGRIVYLANREDLMMNSTGSTLWSDNLPFTPTTNSTPVQSSQYVYTQWGSRILFQNSSTGAIQANVPVPYTYLATGISLPGPTMALAYGKLFVMYKNYVFAYGTCSVNPNDSILAAVATLYLNGQGSCATYLLNQIYPNANYSFTINNVSRINTASFTGGTNYIVVPNSALSQMTNYTISMWINAASFSAQPALYSDYLSNGEKLYITSAGNADSYIWNGASDSVASSTTALSTSKWYLITQTVRYNPATGKTTHSIWVNGANQSTSTFSGTVATDSNGGVIGSMWGEYQYFDGQIADVQIYNWTLTPTQINTIYHEGLTAPPATYKNLTAWLPLEGDTNSYGNSFYGGYPVGPVSYASASYNSTTLSNSYSISAQSVQLPLLNYTTGTYRLYDVGVYAWR